MSVFRIGSHQSQRAAVNFLDCRAFVTVGTAEEMHEAQTIQCVHCHRVTREEQ